MAGKVLLAVVSGRQIHGTEVRLDGWHEDSLGQQMDDGGG